MAQRSRSTEGVDFFSFVADIPGCLKSCLPEDRLAVLGYSREDQVRIAEPGGKLLKVPINIDRRTYNLRLVTSDGCIHVMPEQDSVDAHLNEALSEYPVDARKVVYSMLGIPVDLLRVYRQNWQDPVEGKPGFVHFSTFYCVYADTTEVKYALARRGAGLVLEVEQRNPVEILRQQRWTYAAVDEIMDAAWQAELNERIMLFKVDLSGAHYRTEKGLVYLDSVEKHKPTLFGKFAWQMRLLAWINGLKPHAHTAVQKCAVSSMMKTVNAPMAMFDVEQFHEDLSRFTSSAHQGMIRADELFSGASAIKRGVQFKDWRYLPKKDDPITEFFPDIRRVIVT